MQFFQSRVDNHSCLHLRPLQPFPAETLKILILQHAHLKAIWLTLSSIHLQHLQYCLDNGFTMHHCRPNNQLVMLYKIRTNASIPHFGGLSLGGGALCLREKQGRQQILLVQEKGGPRKGFYGPPCGTSDPGQSVIQATQRQLKEQVNMKGQFLFAARVNFDQGDIYFCSVFRASDSKPEVDNVQISDYKWVPIENLKQIQKQFIGTGKLVLLEMHRLWQEGCKFLQAKANRVFRSHIAQPIFTDIQLITVL